MPPGDSLEMSNVSVATESCDISLVNKEKQSACPTPMHVKVSLNFMRKQCRGHLQ